MTKLHDEMARRFPEIADRMRIDEDLPYMLMHHLAEWLGEMPLPYAPELVNRVVEFWKWCEDQPRGKTAADDLLTILIVGFYEELFGSANTRALIPKLVTKADFVGAEDYLKIHVGEEFYNLALSQFGPGRNSGHRHPAKRKI